MRFFFLIYLKWKQQFIKVKWVPTFELFSNQITVPSLKKKKKKEHPLISFSFRTRVMGQASAGSHHFREVEVCTWDFYLPRMSCLPCWNSLGSHQFFILLLLLLFFILKSWCPLIFSIPTLIVSCNQQISCH